MLSAICVGGALGSNTPRSSAPGTESTTSMTCLGTNAAHSLGQFRSSGADGRPSASRMWLIPCDSAPWNVKWIARLPGRWKGFRTFGISLPAARHSGWAHEGFGDETVVQGAMSTAQRRPGRAGDAAEAPVRVRTRGESLQWAFSNWCRIISVVILFVGFLGAVIYASAKLRFVEDVLPRISGASSCQCVPPRTPTSRTGASLPAISTRTLPRPETHEPPHPPPPPPTPPPTPPHLFY